MFNISVRKTEMRNIKNMNMKTRCFFLAVALSLTGSAAFAQQSEEGAQVQVKDQDAEVGRVSISPYAVLTYSPYSTHTDVGYFSNSTEKNLQFGAGIEGEYRFQANAGVSLGVIYSLEGISVDETFTSGGGLIGYSNHRITHEYVMKRLHVPAMLCVHPMVNGRLSFKVGIQADFLLNGGSNGLDKFDTFGFTLPIGLSLRLGDTILVDARYNAGLTNLKVDTDGSVSHSYFNRRVYLTLSRLSLYMPGLLIRDT